MLLEPSTASGFAVSSRDRMPQFTLTKGAEGSVDVIVRSEAYEVSNATLGLTLSDSTADLSKQMLPPGVEVEFSPPTVTLNPHESKSVKMTIKADKNASSGAYLTSLKGASNGQYTDSCGCSWLVIGPYTPHQAFSLVDQKDFIAKNETTNAVELLEGSNRKDFVIIRSENASSSLTVGLSLENIDVPQKVELSLQTSQLIVPAGSQVTADVEIKVPNGTVPGIYHFKLIAKNGNETHAANFNLAIKPASVEGLQNTSESTATDRPKGTTTNTTESILSIPYAELGVGVALITMAAALLIFAGRNKKNK